MAYKDKTTTKAEPSTVGFTLLEVMIGMAVFTVVALALTTTIVNTWQVDSQAKSATEAAVLGSRVLESIISRSYQDGAIANGSQNLEEDGYTVDFFISDDAVLPRTKFVQMNVSYNLGGTVKNVRINYLIPEIIR
jgi:prepilin-type N-terminal cleavage/methylation domain-containing protein